MPRTEAKVKAGSAGALAAGLIDWLLAKYLFPHLDDATGQALILAAVPAVIAYAAAWLAPHTPRATTAATATQETGNVILKPPAAL